MTLLPQRLIIVLLIIFTSLTAQAQWHLNPKGINGYTINTQLVPGNNLQLITADKPVTGIECGLPEQFRYYRVSDSVMYIKGIGQARHLIISKTTDNTIAGIFMLVPAFNTNYEEVLNLHFGKKQFMFFNHLPLQSSLGRSLWIKDAIRVLTDAEDEKQLSVAISMDVTPDKPKPVVMFSHSRKGNTD